VDHGCILSEGQRDGEVQVLKIDPKAETATVNNSGTVMVIDFEKNGPMQPKPALPPPRPRFSFHTVAR
jgi:hypothetical protein